MKFVGCSSTCFRCVRVLAAEHRYKLLSAEKKTLQNKRERDAATGEGEESAGKKPRGKAKAKAKSAAKKD